MSIDRLFNLSLQIPTLWRFSTNDDPDSYLYVQSTSLQFPQFEIQRDGARYQYYSNYEEVSEFSITFLETNEFRTLGWLEDWMDEIFDRKRKVFRVGDHSKIGRLTFEKSIESETGRINLRDTRTYIFEGMLLVGIDQKDLDYTSTDAFTVSATFNANTIRKL